eukprot:Gregarina_sp_Poly_1__868@NODE_1207_length_4783_cov_48_825700_g827_i0_p1_GENE_NODE_1207_length_4783_cov_48_825700_g827_i0NODE_1207_length_4783_cov_48_825700_g827_i0_p1_ORF_typecomplete_len458_score60_85PAN_1/PF00024_26/6e03PAN_1/PF00024_26/5_3e02PAN_1/PF00024_26/2_6e08PAN_4/PF14295_6/3_4e03PAN_4/PF14295_6/5_9e02PAN_4/PF14295_6/1_5e06PAN_3/PF08277_12/4_3e03PAN_3/PF08277_12/8_6e02PAN_3/PF08277_12/0_025_NODE_1207_length_4783_cov_48_825700_g827_i032394612
MCAIARHVNMIMKLLYLFTAIPFLSSDAADCFAPSLNVGNICTSCSESATSKNDICLTPNHHASLCQPTVDDCCLKNSEIVDKQGCKQASEDHESTCASLVSRTGELTNDECQRKCRDGNDKAAINKLCFVQNNELDECFNDRVYGYSEFERAGLDQTTHFTDSVQKCQQLCQETPDCVYFIWHKSKDECHIKDAYLMSMAVAQEIAEGVPINPTFCNNEMLSACDQLYDCLQCADKRVCAWHSDVHIAGPKWCHPSLVGDWNICEAAPVPWQLPPTAAELPPEPSAKPPVSTGLSGSQPRPTDAPLPTLPTIESEVDLDATPPLSASSIVTESGKVTDIPSSSLPELSKTAEPLKPVAPTKTSSPAIAVSTPMSEAAEAPEVTLNTSSEEQQSNVPIIAGAAGGIAAVAAGGALVHQQGFGRSQGGGGEAAGWGEANVEQRERELAQVVEEGDYAG